jgi:cardiolipin synthase (CMP-forming)
MLTTLPNLLTLSRIVAVPLVIASFYVEGDLGNWLGFAIFAVACITDFFDGYVARAWAQQSHFGRLLDPIADKLLVSAIILMLVATDRVVSLAILPAVVILCREILVSGLREFLASAQVRLPVSRLAQWKTAVQMLALGFLLVGEAGPPFGPLSTSAIGVAGLWAAAIITLYTGYDYLRAGLHHVDRLDSAPPQAVGQPAPRQPRPAIDASVDAAE